MTTSQLEIYSVSIGENFLLYAPLHEFLALVNGQALEEIRQNLLDPNSPSTFIQTLQSPAALPDASPRAAFDPLFLGIIPTRNCNIDCQYCDFAAPKQSNPVMDVSLARVAIDEFLALKKAAGSDRAEIQFFGGEPFFAPKVVRFAVEYATMRAAELGIQPHFEVTTNGVYGANLSAWIAEHFNSVVLSLDGPQDIQDLHRPGRNGKSAFAQVYNTARVLSESETELILRACITAQTVTRMTEIAQWFCEEFSPAMVCFETLVPSGLSESKGLLSPDPWEFARQFHLASQYLDTQGVPAVHATTELHTCRTSFCPLGKDALIVTPEGHIDACYLLESRWQQAGLDLRLGAVQGGKMLLFKQTLEEVRQLGVHKRPLCADCFCRYHCAGGCYVDHDTNRSPGAYDPLCIETRIITITKLLKRLGQEDLLAHWLSDRTLQGESVWQASDRLL